MIYIEHMIINDKAFVRTYSDTYTIERDNMEYTEAIDPAEFGRTYTETENELCLVSE